VTAWQPGSWREHKPDSSKALALRQALDLLSTRPPIVLAREALRLRSALAEVAAGNAFLLQASDCAQVMSDWRVEVIREKLRRLLQLALVLTYGTGLPVVKVARIGDYLADARSRSTETPGLAEARHRWAPDPAQLLAAYDRSVSAINAVRALAAEGSASPYQPGGWNLDFLMNSNCRADLETATEITKAIRFMAALGISPSGGNLGGHAQFWVAHEARQLSWEQALTRHDSTTGEWWDSSAHLLWLGERSRRPDGTRVEFLRGILNPVEAKLGPAATPEAVVRLCEALNPQRRPGRLILVCRMGARDVAKKLPPILAAVRDSGHVVVWACDPIHANTYARRDGRTERSFADVVGEVRGYFNAHKLAGTWPGGLYVELASSQVPAYCEAAVPQQGDADHAGMIGASESFGVAFQLVDILRRY
jgi:3-deoxy-7-phosphoheptulonate synthase